MQQLVQGKTFSKCWKCVLVAGDGVAGEFLGTAPPCGSCGHFLEQGLAAAKAWILEECTPAAGDFKFTGKGLSGTTAWVEPRSRSGIRPRGLTLKPFSGSHRTAEAWEGHGADVQFLGRSTLLLVGECLDQEDKGKA